VDSNRSLNLSDNMTECIIGQNTTSTTSSTLQDRIRYISATSDCNGTLKYFYWYATGIFQSGQRVRGAVYDSDRNLVAQSEEIVGDGGFVWASGAFGPSSISKNENYYIAFWGNEVDKKVYFYNMSNSLIHYWFYDADYSATTPGGNFSSQNPLSGGSDGTTGWRPELYVTLTSGSSTQLTSFNLPVGNSLGWSWKQGQYNSDNTMLYSVDKKSFIWGVLDSSNSYYCRSGNATYWNLYPIQ
jgi:hypothetical protein